MTELYLTQINLSNPDLPAPFRQVRSWRDQNVVHRAVMTLFPSQLPGPEDRRRTESKILYRVEPIAGHHRVLIQSALKPSAGESRRIDTFHDSLEVDEEVVFRTQVNPVRVQSRTGRRSTVPSSEIATWLIPRLHGATDVSVIDARPIPLEIHHSERPVPLHTVIVDGLCTITDPTSFRLALLHGIGKARSFGCGLVTVARS